MIPRESVSWLSRRFPDRLSCASIAGVVDSGRGMRGGAPGGRVTLANRMGISCSGTLHFFLSASSHLPTKS